MKLIKKFIINESGQGMVEYALIIALVACVVVGILNELTDKMSGVLNRTGEYIN